MASFGGSNIFGFAVTIRELKNPSAVQINEFFGVDGTQSLFGGARGRAFMVSGLLRGDDSADLKSQIRAFDNVDDGVARDLIDNFGDTNSNVIFRNFEPGERVIQDENYHWLQYKALFTGNT